MIEGVIFFVVWVICSAIAYGISLAHFQKGFPFIAKEHYRLDVILSLVKAFLGPISLVFAAIDWKTTKKYGLMYRRPKEKKIDYSFPEGKPDWEI